MTLRNGFIILGVVAAVAIGFLKTYGEVTTHAPRAEMIVSTAWLGEHLDDPDVVVLATGSEQGYEREHIRGAGLVPHSATLGAGHGVLEPDALSDLLSQAGASDDARIVIYGENAMEVGWFYMAFASIGHGDHVSMLSGNMRPGGARGGLFQTGPPNWGPGT